MRKLVLGWIALAAVAIVLPSVGLPTSNVPVGPFDVLRPGPGAAEPVRISDVSLSGSGTRLVV